MDGGLGLLRVAVSVQLWIGVSVKLGSGASDFQEVI